MTQLAKLLIADDDETFLLSTADLLRKAGYDCDSAADADAAAGMLAAEQYDLLISDIKMPGNGQLEFIRDLPRTASGLPVILVTGYPSLDTAIESIHLPVVSYMVKPVDFGELLERVRTGLKFSGTYRLVAASRRRLAGWNQDLERVEQLMRSAQSDAGPVCTSTFLELTMGNVVAALSDLEYLTEAIAVGAGRSAVCHLFNCPRPAALVEGIKEAVTVLEKTKRAFKSKELGELRRRLESLIEQGSRQ